MKTIITIITIMLLFLSNDKVQAQDLTDTKSLLKSKTWVMNEALKITMRVTDTEMIYYAEDEFLGSEKYHLSDKNCIDASYDPAKVGLVSAGNYIFDEKGGCSYIKFANPSEFKMGSSTPENTGTVWITVFAKP
ncbi:hypothetical protein [Flavobacterium cellulosilyticum]|uniref:Uncharacterized protein n=1 Tax=Flavobacterium cellulosilyticum TaxID=2541731 RepID=A0A4R5CJP8_9FLAO|nr:hypothetical protein [Flavobacterium cellulosilyticum]TDD98573.1 hypothetical protein E0F76_05445 [Flavobacterium cellulosilyticum]